MKRISFIFLFFMSMTLFCCAQSNTERLKTILPEYITGLQNKTDVTPLVILIKDLYASTEASDRESFKRVINEQISEQFSNGQKETARSLIYIYQLIAEKDDEQLPLLYLIQGNMYAEQMDSVNLKNMISSLQACSQNNENSSKYIESLNGFLERIRNYVPVTRGIVGRWISDTPHDRFLNIPKYDIEAVYFKDGLRYKYLGWPGNKGLSQIQKEFGDDSLYICWSSEILSDVDLQEISMARGVASTVGTGIAVGVSGGNKDLSSQLAGSLSGMAVEMGANALFDNLFEPSKRIELVEAWLKKVNNNMFEGIFSWKKTIIKSTSDKTKFNEERDTLTLMRWTAESDVIFMVGSLPPVLPYPPYRISLSKPKKNNTKKGTLASVVPTVNESTIDNQNQMTNGIYYEDIQNNTDIEYGRAYLEYKKSKKPKEYIRQYNLEQIEKLRKWCLNNM